MNGWYNPDNILDLIDHILLALAGIGAVAIPSWFAARNHKTISQVRDQVVNSHPNRNLRDDLDRCLAEIENIRKDIHQLGREVLTEREARRSQVDDLRSDVDRMRQR